MKMKYLILPLAFVLFMSGFVAAQTASGTASTISSALCDIQNLIKGVLPTLALIMFFLAAVAYAAGQAFGAEMKAKAQGWAMSLIVGGMVGIILAVIAPFIVNVFAGMMGGGYVTECP